ncbi:MAG TPA: 4Fe-4S cluster-binding domain-containing protein [Proteobacteria bacterium]|nr:4Fe-4S cluster-binding domain-containing protein [Pseudomonadota bacterium]
MPTTANNNDQVCALCPRDCRVRRGAGEDGYCRTGSDLYIASICLHRGEEPPVSGETGICNVFFAHCNLQCIYCQNYQISSNKSQAQEFRMNLPDVIERIEDVLNRGARGVGFVSPSHYVPAMREIISELKAHRRDQTFVFNTSAYDRVETIQELEDEISLYLPDLKYQDRALAEEYSGAADYPFIAGEALKEIFRQKGADLIINPDGTIRSGMIIRHLVLPGAVENSKECLRFIAEKLSPDIHISLMAQYHPPPRVRNHPVLGRTLLKEEYSQVVDEMHRLGFHRGWVQELESHHSYLPDFDQNGVFDND